VMIATPDKIAPLFRAALTDSLWESL